MELPTKTTEYFEQTYLENMSEAVKEKFYRHNCISLIGPGLEPTLSITLIWQLDLVAGASREIHPIGEFDNNK